MGIEKGGSSSRNSLNHFLQRAGFSILLYSIIPLIMSISFFVWGQSSPLHDVVILFLSVFVGGQLLREDTSTITFGLISFVIIDLYYFLIILCTIFDGKFIRPIYNFFWWDKQILSVVCLIGLIWSLINTVLLWGIRNRVGEREGEFGWSNLWISGVIILGFVSVWIIILAFTETGLRRYFVDIPRHVTVQRVKQQYSKPVEAIRKTIRNHSKKHEASTAFPSANGDEKVHHFFDAPEILYVDIQTSENTHTGIYYKNKKYYGMGGVRLKSKVGMESPVLNEFVYDKNGKKQKVIIYSGVEMDRDGTIRTYSIYFDAESLSDKLRRKTNNKKKKSR